MKNTENPNENAIELKPAMIFIKEDGTPLIEPMVFYDRPLDFDRPLPEIPPLDLEYFVNYKKIEDQIGRTLFTDEIPKNLKTDVKVSYNDCVNIKNFTQKNDVLDKINVIKDNDEDVKPYYIMREFLSKEKIIVIKNTFYHYNGITYVEIDDSKISSLLLEKCRKRFVNKSSGLFSDVRNFLKIEPMIQVNEEEIPNNLIALQNGILDISTRLFYKHSPDFLTLSEIKANYYTKHIPTPIFDGYLNTITGGNQKLQERILQAIGYILTPDTNGKCFFLVQGVPDSGKSVFCNLLKKFFNPSAFRPLEAHLLGDKFVASELIGKALCTFPDMAGTPLDDTTVSRIKLMTGNDEVTVPVKHKKNETLICRAKFILATNHPLLIKKDDSAFFKRVVTIPFSYPIDAKDKVKNLESLLFAERDGIASKALAAYFRLVEHKYDFSGDFKPNETVSNAIIPNENFEVQIYKFVCNDFFRNTNGIAFVDDAFKLYQQKYGPISKNEFSHYFQKISSEIHQGIKSRKRKTGDQNPISCILGISYKREEGK